MKRLAVGQEVARRSATRPWTAGSPAPGRRGRACAARAGRQRPAPGRRRRRLASCSRTAAPRDAPRRDVPGHRRRRPALRPAARRRGPRRRRPAPQVRAPAGHPARDDPAARLEGAPSATSASSSPATSASAASPSGGRRRFSPGAPVGSNHADERRDDQRHREGRARRERMRRALRAARPGRPRQLVGFLAGVGLGRGPRAAAGRAVAARRALSSLQVPHEPRPVRCARGPPQPGARPRPAPRGRERRDAARPRRRCCSPARTSAVAPAPARG